MKDWEILLKQRRRIIEVIEQLDGAAKYDGLTVDCVKNSIEKLRLAEEVLGILEDQMVHREAEFEGHEGPDFDFQYSADAIARAAERSFGRSIKGGPRE